MGVVLRYPQFYQVLSLRPRQLPLFPYAHTYAMVQPSVDIIEVVLHARYPIIVKSAPRIYFYLFQRRSDTLTASPGREFSQSVLKLLPWLCMNPDIDALSVPSQCKAKEFKISDCKHTYHHRFRVAIGLRLVLQPYPR